MTKETTEDGRSERARKLREERRWQILDAALKVFAKKGYHATVVSDIVHAADVARGTFYLYFPSKRALFDELLDSLIDELDENIHRVDLSSDAPPPFVQLERNLQWLLSLPQTRPDMLQILLWEAVGLDDELDDKLRAFNRNLYRLTEQSLELGIDMGIVRPCDARILARALVGMLKEVMLSLLIRRDLADVDLEKLGRELLEFGARGILRPQMV